MPRPERTREEELARLIAQQERDAKRDRIRRQEPETEVHPDHTEADDNCTWLDPRTGVPNVR
jgi:hypothetical protein